MSEQSGRNESPQRPDSSRQRPSTPATDMLSDLQRWLLRSSARSMRRELSGQVRRTLGGGQRTGAAAGDVWDTATSEIPPDVGESPECQWCPICRAARRMRESGPGIGGQLSGAGDAVASVVQDAVSALDSILSRTGNSDRPAASTPVDTTAREQASNHDPWSGATRGSVADEGSGGHRQDGAQPGTPPGPDGSRLDGQGHEPDHRG